MRVVLISLSLLRARAVAVIQTGKTALEHAINNSLTELTTILQ
jgi:hypothetical protein